MSETHTTRVIRNFMKFLKASFPEVENRVFLTTSLDHSDNGIDIRSNGGLPKIVLEEPIFKRNDVQTSQARPTKQGTDTEGRVTFKSFSSEDSVDIIFGIRVFSDKTLQMLDITNKFYALFINGPKIVAEKCPDLPAEGTNSYTMEMIPREMRSGKLVNKSNLRESFGKIVIEGVLVTDGQVFEEGFANKDDPVITSESLN